MTYAAQREDLLSGAAELFDVVASGAVKVEINQSYALKDAAQAHGASIDGVTVLAGLLRRRQQEMS